MRVHIVIASINELTNLAMLKDQFHENYHELKIIVVDEGDEKLRRRNNELLKCFNHEFYGPEERADFFRSRFNSGYEKYLSVIPERCHAETSFGFLLSWEEEADVVIEIDDDVKMLKDEFLIQTHIENLNNEKGSTVSSVNKWYNTIDSLSLNDTQKLFPRGHPYALDARSESYSWIDKGDKCVLNMGLWAGHIDLDAITILYHGGLDGRCKITSNDTKKDKVLVNNGTYFAVCSMNTAFVPEIIPAFYQLYMNYLGVDRFDDIWSGIFLKKISDHLGYNMCIGKPLVYHDKRPRVTFKDLRAELEGIVINELLWRVVDDVELNCDDFYNCYNELIYGIEKNIGKFNEKKHRDFINLQIDKMRLWLKVVDKLK